MRLFLQPNRIFIQTHLSGFYEQPLYGCFTLPDIELFLGHGTGTDSCKMSLICFPVQCHCAAALGNFLLVDMHFSDFITRLGFACGDPVTVFHITFIHNEISSAVFAPLDPYVSLGHSIRHGDLFTNYLFCGIQALYWFNPLVWLAFRQMRRDREAYCDWAVLNELGNETERIEYGQTILHFAAGCKTRFHTANGLCQSKEQLKYRLEQIVNFNCSNYRGNRGTCSSTHYIRVDFLEQVVLGEMKRLTKYAVHYEDQFLEAVIGSSQKSAEAEHKRKQKELAAAQSRDNELDGLYERIYEDNLAGKLSDERFAKMSQRYEAEQAELAEKIKLLHHEIDKLSSNSVSTDLFLSTVRKYTRAKKLTPRMLNELINRIEVHQAEKINGEWVQRLTIHYNCIGALFIPDTEPLPVPNVTVNTRRGVYVTYEPAQNE